MRVVVVYRPMSEFATRVETYLEDMRRQTGNELEVINPDTPDGASFCRAYDVVEYPTIIAISNSGQVQNMWRGAILPTISEVSYYASQP